MAGVSAEAWNSGIIGADSAVRSRGRRHNSQPANMTVPRGRLDTRMGEATSFLPDTLPATHACREGGLGYCAHACLQTCTHTHTHACAVSYLCIPPPPSLPTVFVAVSPSQRNHGGTPSLTPRRLQRAGGYGGWDSSRCPRVSVIESYIPPQQRGSRKPGSWAD